MKGASVRLIEGVTLEASFTRAQPVTMVWAVPRPLGPLELRGSKVIIMGPLASPKLPRRTTARKFAKPATQVAVGPGDSVSLPVPQQALLEERCVCCGCVCVFVRMRARVHV